jgi:FKBP-type peptidyl-prolyl cis-trans isomerase SlyD
LGAVSTDAEANSTWTFNDALIVRCTRMTPALRRVITFHYTLLDPTGRLIDSSAGGEPVTYLEGGGQIIEGLEDQLRMAESGAKVRVNVPAAKAYGERDPDQVQRVNRHLLPVEGELKVGDSFQAGEDRHAPVVTVMGIEGEEVLLDANHPLAGVDLTFEIEIVGVRDASAEEIEHGHAHGGAAGGHCH